MDEFEFEVKSKKKVAKMLGIGMNNLNQLIAEGKLKTTRVGMRDKIVMQDLINCLSESAKEKIIESKRAKNKKVPVDFKKLIRKHISGVELETPTLEYFNSLKQEVLNGSFI